MKTDESVIKEFLTKMRTQDNRATAFPFYYVIKTKTSQLVPEGHGDERKYYYDDSSFDSEDEVRDYLEDCGLSEFDVNKEMKRVRAFDVKYGWESKGMFLTEDEAERHLKLNHYHYSDDAFTYVDHAWRAPLMEEFFFALFNYFDIENKTTALNQGQSDAK